MIKSIDIEEKIEFINPETNQVEDYDSIIGFYKSSTNKLLGKVFRKINPDIWYFIPDPDSNLEFIKIPPYTGGYAKLYEIVSQNIKNQK